VRKLLLLLALLMPSLLLAQTTTVTGVVADANSNAYFPGTVSAFIVLATGQPIPSGVPASGSIGPNATTSGGNFSVTLASPYSWIFTFCAAPVNIGPLANNTPKQVCFTTGPIAISGTSQVITSQLGTIPLLGPGSGGSGSTVTWQNQGSTIGVPSTVNCLTNLTCAYAGGTVTISASGGSSLAFSALTSGTNTTAAMLIGTGSSLNVTGSGTNNSTSINGVSITGTPSTGQIPTATSGTAATWQTPVSGTTFSAITGGTNTTAAMLIGTGASLNVTGTGSNNATAIDGITITGTPTTGQVPTFTSGSAGTWQTVGASAANGQNSIQLSSSCPNPNSGPCYYTPANAIQITDGTFTNASQTVTTAGQTMFACPGSSYPCSSGGDVGKYIWGFTSCTTAAIGAVIAQLGVTATTITTVNSATSVQASIAATASSGAATACVIYGLADDTGAALADAAAQALLTCPSILYPAANMIWTTWHFVTNPSTCSRGSEATGGSGIAGWGYAQGGAGKGISHIFLPPWISMTSCTTGSGAACLGAKIPGLWWHDFTFSGGGNSRTGSTSAKDLVEPGPYSEFDRVGFINFGATDGNLPGIYYNCTFASCGPLLLQDVTIDGWGNRSYYCQQGVMYAKSSSFQDSNAAQGSSMYLQNTGGGTTCSFVSNGQNFYAGNPSSPANQDYIYITTGGSAVGYYIFDKDNWGTNGQSTVPVGVFLQGATANTVIVRDSQFNLSNGTAGVGLFANTNGGTYHFSGNTFNLGSTGSAIQSNTGGVFVDDCGNTIITGLVSLTGPLFGSCSITGVQLTNANVTPSAGFGTGAATSAAAGSSLSMVFTTTIGTAPAANATNTVTFPKAFFVAPTCSAQIIGGTSTTILPVASPSPSTTSVVLTYTGTFVTGTVITRLTCQN
jgi:hypothetical protein